MTLDLMHISRWLGVVGYALGVGFCVVWVGISIANWQLSRAWASVWLGLGAAWGALFIAALAAIASDWFPGFSGIYIALAIRISFLLCISSLIGFTVLYLRNKRQGREGLP